MPASVAAEAGSQPMPHWPMIAFASAISCSVTRSTTPFVVSISNCAFGHDTGSPILIAVASVSGCSLRNEMRLPPSLACIRRKGDAPSACTTARRGSRSMKPEFVHLAQPFAEGRNVAEIAAGQHDPIRHVPVALVHHLDHDRFLAFDAERIDRIEQIDAEPLRKHAHQRENLIEVRLHLERLRAVLERLREFAV